ncbi:uracil-DNA glycosylase-like protein [Scheffersomyces xylosifermentans]|uniref:uracil-DNA glycosylase-like protein n=1 Tax=Scheffersomyces xylosifermentans TaxID=1304137 RepID=UPI00315C9C19
MDKLKSLQTFRYKEDKEIEKSVEERKVSSTVSRPSSSTSNRISKPSPKKKKVVKNPTESASIKSKIEENYPIDVYKDVQPSLTENQILLFIGYNPGVESSLQQHHYAHFSNLFWKLFNQSKTFLRVLQRIDENYIEKNIENDELLQSLVKDGITYLKPVHDYDIIKYKVGFTDLVLRCTRTAQELTLIEKLQNVPRLLSEFNRSNCKFLVFIGKGIWEIIVKFMMNELGIKKFKLSKNTFVWGFQQELHEKTSLEEVRIYNLILKKLQLKVPNHSRIYVFPNTSGLVASLSYDEKLALWTDLAADIMPSPKT